MHRRANKRKHVEPAAGTTLDMDVLAELPDNIREEVLAQEAQTQQRTRESKAKTIAKKVLVDIEGSPENCNTTNVIDTVIREGGGEASLLDLLASDSEEEAAETSPPLAQAPVRTLTKVELSKNAHDLLRSNTAAHGKFRLLSWNIDGLDEVSQCEPHDLSCRTAAVCEEICHLGASVVFLQEVVPPALATICRLLGSLFHIYTPQRESAPYFCAILIQRGKLTPLQAESNYIPFARSTMGRGLLSISARVDTVASPVVLHTSHLESTKPCASERHSQLVTCLQQLASIFEKSGGVDNDIESLAVLAGDLNLRDEEAKQGFRDVEKNCKGISFIDAWEHCGSDASCRFTWDPNENTNSVVSGPRSRLPRCRFDRVLFAARRPASVRSAVRGTQKKLKGGHITSECMPWVPIKFALAGKSCRAGGRFLSDHWGVVAEFSAME